MPNPTHLRIQQEILSFIPTAIMERRFDSIGRIGDVVFEEKKVVFEVQFSPIHPIEARERMRDYATIGYQVVWILHENMFNPLRPTPFQEFLSHFPHLYTHIDPLLGGNIYEVTLHGGTVVRRVVQLNKFALKTLFQLRWPFMQKVFRFETLERLNETPLEESCPSFSPSVAPTSH